MVPPRNVLKPRKDGRGDIFGDEPDTAQRLPEPGITPRFCFDPIDERGGVLLDQILDRTGAHMFQPVVGRGTNEC